MPARLGCSGLRWSPVTGELRGVASAMRAKEAHRTRRWCRSTRAGFRVPDRHPGIVPGTPETLGFAKLVDLRQEGCAAKAHHSQSGKQDRAACSGGNVDLVHWHCVMRRRHKATRPRIKSPKRSAHTVRSHRPREVADLVGEPFPDLATASRAEHMKPSIVTSAGSLVREGRPEDCAPFLPFSFV